MKITEVIGRLTSMAFRADHIDTIGSKENADALRAAVEIIENAATEALLPPPKQDIKINFVETDLSKIEERMFAAVQSEDLKPAQDLEAELRKRYRYSGTRTGRSVFVESKESFRPRVSQTRSGRRCTRPHKCFTGNSNSPCNGLPRI